MNAAERRTELLKLITQSNAPVSGTALSKQLGVSRQVIVTDIAILKAAGNDIIATNRGYIINSSKAVSRVFKVVHADDEIAEELNTIVDLGGTADNVFVWHKIYGKIEAPLNVSSRRHVHEYIENLKNGRSAPLKNVTSQYHYHEVTADSEKTLDMIAEALAKKGFLVEEDTE